MIRYSISSMTADANASENLTNSTLNQTAAIWRHHCESPSNEAYYEALANHLHSLLEEMYPTRSLGFPLIGREAEVRQDALQLLMKRYLKGRPNLKAATLDTPLSLVAEEIDKAVKAAWRISACTTMRNGKRHARELHISDDHWKAIEAPSPTDESLFAELDVDVRLALIELSITHLTKQRKISATTAKVASAYLAGRGQINQTQVASRLGITPQAVNQHIHKLQPLIRDHVQSLGYTL